MSASCKTCGDTNCKTRQYNLDICLDWKKGGVVAYVAKMSNNKSK